MFPIRNVSVEPVQLPPTCSICAACDAPIPTLENGRPYLHDVVLLNISPHSMTAAISGFNMTDTLLHNWSNDDFNNLEKGVLLAHHNLIDTGLFTDAGLAKIVDNHPDRFLSINTMGTDTNQFEWREGDRNGVTGETLIELVRQGRFWMNLRGVHKHQPELAQLIN